VGEDSPVSERDGEGQDPFRVTAPGSPAAVAGPPPPPSPQDRARAVRLVILAVAALATAVLAPPVGAVLGVLTLTLAVRSRSLRTATRVVAGVAGGIAVLVGIFVTASALLLRTEITEYSQCLQGANTRLAQQACQDALNEALEDALETRFGLTFQPS
jgi:hypothetical protein